MKTGILWIQLANFLNDAPQTVSEMQIREATHEECLKAKTCHSVWNEEYQAYEIIMTPAPEVKDAK